MDTHKALSAMAANGLAPDQLIPDGRIHRFSGADEASRKKSAWYIAFDNPLSVTYGSWKDPDAKYSWRPEGASEPTPEERQRIQKAIEKRREHEAKQKRRNAIRLRKVWDNAKPARKNHKYLTTKQVEAHGIKQIGKRLLIAMRNSAREVVGLQVIYPNGFKRYAKGSQPSGAYYGIGKPNGHLYITEGFATGATIRQLTDSAVAVAFSAGQLLLVAKAMRAALPDTKIIICADNDRFTSITLARGKVDNPGVHYATEASNATGAELRVPQFDSDEDKPTDFNDLAVIQGNDAALLQLTGEIKPKETNADSPADEIPAVNPSTFTQNGVFRCLGFDEDEYFYLPNSKQQVTAISSATHSNKSLMMSIAPLEYWESSFPTKTGVDWIAATNACMRWNEKVGTFSPALRRGRGAWFDEGRSVLHLGDRLIVDGIDEDLSTYKTRFIYEKKPAMESSIQAQPATAKQGMQLLEMFQGLSWDSNIHALYIAGWCAMAPICGALQWRPHVWMTGQRGTGKSWVQQQMIEPLLGQSAMMVLANTTEAGIRQKLKQDSRPVVFDEAEAESIPDKKRIQQVIELARQASSESTAEIAKGTSGGNAMSFRARSMFLMGSINVNLSMAADESRFTIISLKAGKKTPEQIQSFKKTEADVHKLLSNEFCASIRSRMYQMIPTLRKNAKVFSQAVAEKIGSQRIGDQIGALLSGVCALTSDDEITIDQARKWVEPLDFSDAEEAEQASDEERCLHEILQAHVRVGSVDKTVSELIQSVIYGADEHTQRDANDVLLRHGMRVVGTKMDISNTHTGIRELLKNSPWSGSWKTILGRIEGATKPSPVNFNGTKTRATCIPITNFVHSA